MQTIALLLILTIISCPMGQDGMLALSSITYLTITQGTYYFLPDGVTIILAIGIRDSVTWKVFAMLEHGTLLKVVLYEQKINL